MSYVHTSTFRVRHYECDPHGWVRHTALLGYFQEAAFDASAVVGYGAARYAEIGYHWFAYETQLEVLKPLKYDDTIQIRTWIVDFRRVRSLRCYEAYLNGELVAHGSTDWVFINAKTLYPSSIPPEIVEAYSRNEPTPTPTERAPFPVFPQTPAEPFVMRRQVEARDLDPAGHVNNAVYLHYATEAERLAVAAKGWTVQRLASENVLLWIKRLQIEYKLAALLDDELTIATWADQTQRFVTISRDQKLLARMQWEWGWINAATGEPTQAATAFLRDI